ncbi:hypothetical protein EXIGLDRAFT_833145 [Exidia glandulosa HHB12029]|uniref:F-box domain-containing protein n=1 Tax=Exidia glandulosa HHB12029 TaxID=1314781 RepID=A0A165KWS7_EXIGL|nr:hypothetical protein EXIGLDRAFT_833145 [Exidia glandulosa HHB12029]
MWDINKTGASKFGTAARSVQRVSILSSRARHCALALKLKSRSFIYCFCDRRDVHELNIACSDLEDLSLTGLHLRNSALRVGQSTRQIAIGGCAIKLTDIVAILQRASRLETLEVGAILGPLTRIVHDVNPEDIASSAASVLGSLPILPDCSICELESARDYEALQDVISTSSIRRGQVFQTLHGSVDAAWVRFLDLPSLGDIDELRMTGSRGEEIDFVASKTQRRRHLYCEKVPGFACLPLAFDSHPTIFSTLEVLSFGIVQWTSFMEMVEIRGAQMPRLTHIDLTVNPYDVEELTVDEHLQDYQGYPIDMPRLETVAFDIGGSASNPPSVELTMHFLAVSLEVLRCMTPGQPRSGVAFVGGDEARAALAGRCEEIANGVVKEEERTELHELAAAFLPYILGKSEKENT